MTSRGIRMQTIGLRHWLLRSGCATTRRYLRSAVDLGQELRAAERLPVAQLILADRSTALVPVPAAPAGQAGLLIHSEELVRPLDAAFQETWNQSQIIGSLDHDPLHQLDLRPRRIVALLADGLTDQAIASELGVTDRTVRREVALLCRVLQVDGRFQLGLEIARRGWL
ncbi:helix-turn-helix domain-containing protein [Kribbella sp. GL6]|uniref:helix-turn-helix transcriptional regulator n=1 Tax=Kribbella sp. GL6 TaxID=3419765 RepID=UPI003D0236D3